MKTVIALVFLAVTASSLHAQTLTPAQQYARDVYKEIIEFNSVNIGGGTTEVANAVAKRFRDAGFADQDIFLGGIQPNKHNVVVRYRGKGGANGPKPLLLLAHLDVVEALKADWSPGLDPFTFLEKDGYFYGRGIIDDKAQVAIFTAVVVQMKKDGYVPDRDIVVAFTADEEGGCCNGARWLFSNHRELVDASLVLNEGAFGFIRNGKPVANTIEATQKVTGGFTVTAKNRGGHSSLPRPDNAIYQLAAGLMKLSAFKFPVEFNDVSRAYFEQTAKIETPRNAAAMRALIKNPADIDAEARAGQGSPLQLDAAHHLRGDDAQGWSCVERAAANGGSGDQLPHDARRAHQRCSRDDRQSAGRPGAGSVDAGESRTPRRSGGRA